MTDEKLVKTESRPARMKTEDGCYIVDAVKYGSMAFTETQEVLKFSKRAIRDHYRTWIGKPVKSNHGDVIGNVSDAILKEVGDPNNPGEVKTTVRFKIAVTDEKSKSLMEKNFDRIGTSVETKGPSYDDEGWIHEFEGSAVSISLPVASGNEGCSVNEGCGLKNAEETFSENPGEVKMVDENGGKTTETAVATAPQPDKTDNRSELREVVALARENEQLIREEREAAAKKEETLQKEIEELRAFKAEREEHERVGIIEKATKVGLDPEVIKDLSNEKISQLAESLKSKSMPTNTNDNVQTTTAPIGEPKTQKEIHAEIKAALERRTSGQEVID